MSTKLTCLAQVSSIEKYSGVARKTTNDTGPTHTQLVLFNQAKGTTQISERNQRLLPLHSFESAARTLLAGSTSVLRGLLAHGAAEEFGQRGVEGGVGLLFDLLQGFVDGEGSTFWLFGGEVVKHLGNADNASEQGRAVSS